MRFTLSKSISLLALLSLLFVTALAEEANKSSEAVAPTLPKVVGDFRLQETISPYTHAKDFAPEDYGIKGEAAGTYVSTKGERINVWVARTRSQSGAYALLTRIASKMRGAGQSQATKLSDVGTAGFAGSSNVIFYQGTTIVSITGNHAPGVEDIRIFFARAFVQTLEAADKEIPVLVKHLPDWEKAQDRAVYALSFRALQDAVGQQQPVLEAITFEAGAEAVTALYDNARLVIVEHTTPQLSVSDDERITARISELQAQGQSVPSAYRRVGNYAVFVFNAPDETAAAQLIDQVKYEQSVQWLGDNPLAWEYANRRYTQSAMSLIIGIAKTIGFFVALCLGAGVVFGGMVFMRRRTQQSSMEGYSDAGGMLRLNLDELTPETDPARLLTSGDKKAISQ